MVVPVLPDVALAPLGALVTAGMDHEATLERFDSVRLPNGEYTGGWVDEEPVKALLTVAGVQFAAVAAAQGVKAQWALRLPQTAVPTPGKRALVRGVNDTGPWQRLVEITADLGLTKRLIRLASAVDVALNQ